MATHPPKKLRAVSKIKKTTPLKQKKPNKTTLRLNKATNPLIHSWWYNQVFKAWWVEAVHILGKKTVPWGTYHNREGTLPGTH